MLGDQEKERLRTLTMEVVLALRAMYLQAFGSTVVLSHWTQIQDRMRSATRTTANVEEWVTDICKNLRLPAPSSLASSAVFELAAYVREHAGAGAWLDLIDREWGYIMAVSRETSEKRKAARLEKAPPSEGTA